MKFTVANQEFDTDVLVTEAGIESHDELHGSLSDIDPTRVSVTTDVDRNLDIYVRAEHTIVADFSSPNEVKMSHVIFDEADVRNFVSLSADVASAYIGFYMMNLPTPVSVLNLAMSVRVDHSI